MQERHDNDEIESHNHNEYPLLYKEAEISTSSLGKFLECRCRSDMCFPVMRVSRTHIPRDACFPAHISLTRSCTTSHSDICFPRDACFPANACMDKSNYMRVL